METGIVTAHRYRTSGGTETEDGEGDKDGKGVSYDYAKENNVVEKSKETKIARASRWSGNSSVRSARETRSVTIAQSVVILKRVNGMPDREIGRKGPVSRKGVEKENSVSNTNVGNRRETILAGKDFDWRGAVKIKKSFD